MDDKLKSAFRFHMRHARPAFYHAQGYNGRNAWPEKANGIAVECLKRAREDVANGKTRYPREQSMKLNKPFHIAGDRSAMAQWCENPTAFRYVGLSHEIAPDRQHTTGYYVDYYQCEIATGAVYQMRSLNGCARYIPAIPDQDNGGPVMLFLSDIVTADSPDEYDSEQARKEAARDAMGFAETYAEHEREYNTAWQAGSRANDYREDAQSARQAFLALMKEIKGNVYSPAVCLALKSEAIRLVDTWRDAKEMIVKLRSGDAEGYYFYPDERLQAAFAEGYGR